MKKIQNDEYEYRKTLNKLCVFKNCVTLICFTILAIVFNKWWVVLFSSLFMCYVGKED